MMWDNVIQVVLVLLQTDDELKTLLGGPHIYRAKSRASIQTPGVYYTVVSDRVQENLEPVVVQWDVWGTGAVQVAAIEKRLYKLMHNDLPVEIGGLKMWSQYEDAHDEDSDQSICRRMLEYRYTPARMNG